MSEHKMDFSMVLLTNPPCYRCSCGSTHTDEEYREIVIEEAMVRWARAMDRLKADFEIDS